MSANRLSSLSTHRRTAGLRTTRTTVHDVENSLTRPLTPHGNGKLFGTHEGGHRTLLGRTTSTSSAKTVGSATVTTNLKTDRPASYGASLAGCA